MNNCIELDILVKVLDLKYTLHCKNEKSIIFNTKTVESANLTLPSWSAIVFIQFQYKTSDIIENIIITCYPKDLAIIQDFNIDNYTYNYQFNIENLKKIMETYLSHDYYLFFRNYKKTIVFLKQFYSEEYELLCRNLDKKQRVVFCLDSILKTIVKMPIIVQGRQVSRKYRIPTNQMVFDNLDIKNNSAHLKSFDGDRVFFYSILPKIDELVFNRDFLKDSPDQTSVFMANSNSNINIISKSSYSGKTVSALYRVVSLVYNGVDIENIYFVVSNPLKKKNLEQFWATYIEPSLGYLIKIYTIDNFNKHKIQTIEYIFIDINHYDNQDNINSIESIIETYNPFIVFVGNMRMFTKISNRQYNIISIDDIDFEKNTLAIMNLETINDILDAPNSNSLFVLDNRVNIDIKNRVREKVPRDNIINPKKLSLEFLDGLEFSNCYLLYNSKDDNRLPDEIMDELRKRSTKDCIIYTN
jgi:hypothetical protein